MEKEINQGLVSGPARVRERIARSLFVFGAALLAVGVLCLWPVASRRLGLAAYGLGCGVLGVAVLTRWAPARSGWAAWAAGAVALACGLATVALEVWWWP
jgi:hypothetical protein